MPSFRDRIFALARTGAMPRSAAPSSWAAAMPKARTALGSLIACLLAAPALARAETHGSLHLSVHHAGDSAVIPARVHLRKADGTRQKAPRSPWNTNGMPVFAPGLPHHFDHFTMEGDVQVELAPGRYLLTVERGPEYRSEPRAFEILAGKTESVDVPMRRWIDMKGLGWWSGETHIHRPLDEIPLLVKAEDLHVAPVLSVWNESYPWAQRALPRSSLAEVAPGQWVHWFSTEDEREGGALLLMNLQRPFPLEMPGSPPGTKNGREFPSPVSFMKRALRQRGVWLDVEKPSWWDMPAWIATGEIDSIGIANNHMNRDQAQDTEAWGKGRNREEFPGPHGNGLYSQFLYYQILNAGFQIPPSAGSASGVLPNPVGYNRAYVFIEDNFTYARWWQELARGRVFVTNGPMLLVEANGRKPGERFRIDGQGKLNVALDVRVGGNDPIEAVEVIVDGKVVERIESPGAWITPKPISFQRSGWFLVRAIAAVPGTFRFASTGPFYVQAGGKPVAVHRDAVEFFLHWLDERIADIRAGKAEKLAGKALDAVLKPQLNARRVFQRLLERAE